jgi:hypothetical protein
MANQRLIPVYGYQQEDASLELLSDQLSSMNFDGSITRVYLQKPVSSLQAGDALHFSSSQQDEVVPVLVSSVELDDSEDELYEEAPVYFIYYLDQDGNLQPYTLGSVTSDGGYLGTELVYTSYEDPTTIDVGTSGWTITKYGNAVFSNVFTRGTIEATAGKIDGVLTIGADENTAIQLGKGISVPGDPEIYNGLVINDTNYFVTKELESTTYTISSAATTTETVSSGLSLVTFTINSHGLFTDISARNVVNLFGFTEDLSVLNNGWTLNTSDENTITVIVPRITSGTYTGLTAQLEQDGVAIRKAITSAVVSDVADVTKTNITFTTSTNHNLVANNSVNISGLPTALEDINGVFLVISVTSNTFTIRDVTVTGTSPYTGLSASVVKAFNSERSVFNVGSQSNFMKYDSADDKLLVTGNITASTIDIGGSSGISYNPAVSSSIILGSNVVVGGDISTATGTITGQTFRTSSTATTNGVIFNSSGISGYNSSVKKFDLTSSGILTVTGANVTGAINATSGNFTNTVTIGTAETNGSLKVGTGAQHFKIDGTPTNTTTAIYTASASFGESGVWLDASGRFSLGSKFNWDGSALSITGAINATSGYIGGESSGWQITTDIISSVGGTNKVYLVNGSNPKISITSNSTSKGSFIAGDTPFYVDGDGRLSLGTQMYFDPNDTQSFGKLTVIGRISGAIDNVTTIPTDSNTFSVSQAVISGTNQAVLTTTATHTFIAGDTVVVAGLTGNASVANGAFVVLSTPAPTATTFAVTISSGTNGTVTDQTGTAKIREMTLGLHGALSGSPAGYGIRLDENNYWFVNNQFKVGTSGSYFSWDGATLEVKGKVTSTDGEIGAWTLSNEELYSDISDTGNTYRTGIKAATGIGGDIYTPSVFYMVHDHDISNQTPSWAEPWTPFYADSNGRFSLSDRLYFDQDIHNSTGAKLTALINSGRIGGFDATDPLGWTIGRGFLYSGYGTSFVSLAAPGAVPDANSAIFFTPTKITVDAEGGGYSSIYIELEFYSATGYTSLAKYLEDNNNLGYTQSQIEASSLIYEECVANVFSDTLGRFVNIEGSTSLNNTSINPEFDNLANRYLSIQAAETYPYYLEQNSSTSASSATESVGFGADSEKIILVIYGEDYVYSNIKDEQIIFPFDVTINIGSSTFTKVSHGLEAGDEIRFTTGGSLPTGIALNTTYYVRDVLENSFKVSSTLNGIAVSLSGTQSGTHTIVKILESTLGGGEDFYSSGKIEIYVAQNNTLNLPVFWAGDTDPQFSSISITNTGNISSNSLTSSSVITDSFKLSDYNVIISDTEPDGAVAGDIWIDIS